MSKEGGIQGTLPFSAEEMNQLYPAQWVVFRWTDKRNGSGAGNVVAHGQLDDYSERVTKTLKEMDILPIHSIKTQRQTTTSESMSRSRYIQNG